MASWSGGGAGGKDGGVDGEQYVVSDGVEYTNIPFNNFTAAQRAFSTEIRHKPKWHRERQCWCVADAEGRELMSRKPRRDQFNEF